MWTRIRTVLSLNDPGWGRSGSGGSNDDRSGRSGDDRPQRPGGGNNDGPPDLDELWRDFNRRLNRMFGKGGGGGEPPRGGGPSQMPSMKGAGAGIGLIAGIAFLLWLGSGFYIIQEGQAAAILRFGEFKYMVESAGFKWRLPYPIETAEPVDVQRLRQVEVGYRTNVKNKVPRESLILTGDQAIVDLQFAVQYRITDPKAYLFNNNPGGAPEEIVRQAAETATREVIGRMGIDQVLYEEKEQVAKDALTLMQSISDRYRAGIGIVDVTIQQAQPPEQVQAAFEDANKAAQDRERLINEGRAYANDVIPKARGTASRLQQESEGYKQRVIASAEGDASRFKQVLTEYAKAPAVTRDRLYIETMQQVLSNTSKVLVESRAGNNLLYLPLDRLLQQASADAARAQSGASGAQPADGRTDAPAVQAPPMPAGTRDGLRGRDRDSGR
ncbi:MAG: FtsH protease activity modulator HflK [Burkholderiales bacterium]|jgi:membrane protease subunit HflK|nr:FtsH protease activity modulator HflK [Burkholderiales bacterium]